MALEASILIVVVCAALLAMMGYLRRSAQGKWRGNVDSFSPKQFAARSTTGGFEVTNEGVLGDPAERSSSSEGNQDPRFDTYDKPGVVLYLSSKIDVDLGADGTNDQTISNETLKRKQTTPTIQPIGGWGQNVSEMVNTPTAAQAKVVVSERDYTITKTAAGEYEVKFASPPAEGQTTCIASEDMATYTDKTLYYTRVVVTSSGKGSEKEYFMDGCVTPEPAQAGSPAGSETTGGRMSFE